MFNLQNLLIIAISAVLIDNFVFSKYLGLCPYFGVSRKLSSAIGMGLAVTFVITISVAITKLVDIFLLIPYKIEYLRIITFILVIASTVQFVEMVIKKFSPELYKALGIYLPLITTNCAVLGSTLLVSQALSWNYVDAVTFGFFAGIGFMLALVIMSGIRERISMLGKTSKYFEDLPIAFITASLIALALMGFKGLGGIH